MIEEVERARAAALARPRVQLVVTAPAACQVHVDGVIAGSAPLAAVTGPHWIRAHCDGYLPWGGRFELRDPVTRIGSVRWLGALRDQPVRGKALKKALTEHRVRM